MKAFVTGSTGFIGRRLVDELLARGYQVTALVRTLDRARQLPVGLRYAPGDVTRRAGLRSGMQAAQAVFHLAALCTVGLRPAERERMRRINLEGTRHVLELAAELGVPRIVHVSCLEAYGDTGGQWIEEASQPDPARGASEYARTKALAQCEVAAGLQRQGAPVMITCLGQVYGPGGATRLAGRLRLYARRRLPVMIGPQRTSTWLHVDDAAAGLRLAAERGRPGETYFLAGPAATEREFFLACQRATGLPAPRLWLPGRLADWMARAAQDARPAWAERWRMLADVTSLARAGKAGAELGWSARPVEDGVRDLLSVGQLSGV